MATKKKTSTTEGASTKTKVVEKIVEKKVEVVKPLLSEEEEVFLADEVSPFLKALYLESEHVGVKTRLQNLQKLISRLVEDNKDARNS